MLESRFPAVANEMIWFNIVIHYRCLPGIQGGKWNNVVMKIKNNSDFTLKLNDHHNLNGVIVTLLFVD